MTPALERALRVAFETDELSEDDAREFAREVDELNRDTDAPWSERLTAGSERAYALRGYVVQKDNMSKSTITNYQSYRAERGLPPTLPPPPMAADLRAKAKQIRDDAARNLAVANELDAMADAMAARE